MSFVVEFSRVLFGGWMLSHGKLKVRPGGGGSVKAVERMLAQKPGHSFGANFAPN